MCRNPTHCVGTEEDETLPEYRDSMHQVRSVHSGGNRTPYEVDVVVQGRPVRMEVDTEATLSLMTNGTYLTTWKGVQALQIKPLPVGLCTYTGENLKVVGVAEVDVQYGDQRAMLNLVIVDGSGPSLLGQDWLEVIRLDWGRFNKVDVEVKGELESVLSKHSALFKDELGAIEGVKAKLYLKEGAKPIFCRARPVPFAIQEKVQAKIDCQVRQGILEPVNGNYAY